MKAIDLLTGHAHGCDADWLRSTGAVGPCTCRLALRQEQARAIDARVEALERALLDTRVTTRHAMSCASWGWMEDGRDFGPCDCGTDAALARIDALLAEDPDHAR